ncbi:MAG: hypothetical protein RR162_09710, partial [Oscillospiraceae bacterium]
IAAVGSAFERDGWHIAVPIMAVAFIAPYAFTLYGPILAPSAIYMSIMADVPIGMVFAGTLCSYYCLKDRQLPVWPVMVALGMLTMIKDTAFPIAMVAAGIMCVDIVISKDNCTFLKLKGIVAKLAQGAMLLATPVITFVWWVVYLGRALNVDATGDIGGTEGMGMAQMLVEGIKQFLGIGTTEKFTTLMNKMYSSFFTMNLTVLGSGLRIVLIIAAMLAVAYLITDKKEHKIRCVSFGIISALGFLAYYVFIGFCYVFVFKDVESQNLMSYERYIYPYYIGWFLAALFLLSMSLKAKGKRLFGAGQLVIFGILALMVIRLSVILTQGKTFIDFDEGYLYDRREQTRKAQSVMEYLSTDEQDKIF